MTAQEIVQRGFHFADAVVADRLAEMLQGGDIQMVLQIGAHAGGIQHLSLIHI